MEFDGGDAMHRLLPKHAGYQVIQRTHRDKADPTQRAAMHMGNAPVGVMRQRIDGFDGHHGSLKGGNAVKRQRHNHETQDRIVAQFVPCTRQRHHAIDHAAPARR